MIESLLEHPLVLPLVTSLVSLAVFIFLLHINSTDEEPAREEVKKEKEEVAGTKMVLTDEGVVRRSTRYGFFCFKTDWLALTVIGF